MAQSIKTITAATAAPITVLELKEHLHIAAGDTSHDTYLGQLVTAASDTYEGLLGRRLMPQTLSLGRGEFPAGRMGRPWGAQRAVTPSKYTDSDGTASVMETTDYRVDVNSEPGRLSPRYGGAWPATRPITAAVAIEFACGFALPADVPESAKWGIQVVAAHWFKHREPVVEGSLAKLPMSVLWAANLGTAARVESGVG